MELLSYAVRLKSLRSWPCRKWFDIGEFARAGLYYPGHDEDSTDRLRCAFCEFVVANWKSGDNVWKMHASFVPTCWNLLSYKGKEFVQSVLQEEEENGEETRVLDRNADRSMYAQRLRSEDLTVLGISGYLLRKQQSSSSSPSSKYARNYTTARGVLFQTPKHMEMVQPEKRSASFDNTDPLCRLLLNLDKSEEVVKAGFYFTGDGDSVRCYYCDAGFKNWNRMDDPWVEHARHAPHCMHVILTKGEEFVEKVLRDTHGEMKRTFPVNRAGTQKRQLEPEMEEENIGHVSKKFKVFGISDREGVEKNRPEGIDQFPSTVSSARRYQRCLCCNTAKRKQRIKQEANLQALGESIRTQEPACWQNTCDLPQVCGICKRYRNGLTAIGSVCCRVCVCESCSKRNPGHCLSCGRP